VQERLDYQTAGHAMVRSVEASFGIDFSPFFIKEKWIDPSAVKSRGKVVIWPFFA
jgi:hypothetical protein